MILGSLIDLIDALEGRGWTQYSCGKNVDRKRSPLSLRARISVRVGSKNAVDA